MKHEHTKKIIFTALCIAIGFLLPQVVKSLPIPNGGAILLPMHIPVLICGFLAGARYGAISGFVLPVLAYVLTGMPQIFPTGLSMMLELATYGALTGFLFRLTNGNIILSLVGAMLGGRAIYGIVHAFLFNVSDFGFAAFISGSFVIALPGIIIQLILVPAVVYGLMRAKLIPSPAKNK